ncbi:MAG TPA: IS66 family insertion sequence element accessory protein TnpB [Myxococcota bacterium]
MAKAMRARRVRRDRAQWQRLIEEQGASGLTQQAFCTRRRVAYATFCTWKRRLRDEVNGQPPGFVEVDLDEAPMPGWDVELELGEGIVLRVRRR